jgi:hypothetical protein
MNIRINCDDFKAAGSFLAASASPATIALGRKTVVLTIDKTSIQTAYTMVDLVTLFQVHAATAVRPS